MRNQISKISKDYKNEFNHRAFLFSTHILKLTDSLPNKRACYIISDQLIRSATSIGANIIEAKAASSKKDYINFYSHALKSSNETKYWLMLLKESKYIQNSLVDTLLQEVTELSNILGASIITMKKSF